VGCPDQFVFTFAEHPDTNQEDPAADRSSARFGGGGGGRGITVVTPAAAPKPGKKVLRMCSTRRRHGRGDFGPTGGWGGGLGRMPRNRHSPRRCSPRKGGVGWESCREGRPQRAFNTDVDTAPNEPSTRPTQEASGQGPSKEKGRCDRGKRLRNPGTFFGCWSQGLDLAGHEGRLASYRWPRLRLWAVRSGL